jgi:hypothetical protein
MADYEDTYCITETKVSGEKEEKRKTKYLQKGSGKG